MLQTIREANIGKITTVLFSYIVFVEEEYLYTFLLERQEHRVDGEGLFGLSVMLLLQTYSRLFP
jgi:hypothetical protein